MNLRIPALFVALATYPSTARPQSAAASTADSATADTSSDVAILAALAEELARRRDVLKSSPPTFPGADGVPLVRSSPDPARQFLSPQEVKFDDADVEAWVFNLAADQRVPSEDELAYLEVGQLERILAVAGFRFVSNKSIIGANNMMRLGQLEISPDLPAVVRRELEKLHAGMRASRLYTPLMARAGADITREAPYALITEKAFTRAKICADEVHLKNEASSGVCSGVVLSRHAVLTAGHCLDHFTRDTEVRFVFGFEDPHDGSAKLEVFEGEVFARGTTKNDDWVVFKTSADLQPRRVPRLATRRGAPSTVYAAGYPMATPFTLIGHGRVHRADKDRLFTSLDSYRGLSGGPVFNIRGELEGIVVAGGRGLYDVGTCQKSCECSEQYTSAVSACQCQPEQVFRIFAVLEQLKQLGKELPR